VNGPGPIPAISMTLRPDNGPDTELPHDARRRFPSTLRRT
jgi:hypothetical protein